MVAASIQAKSRRESDAARSLAKNGLDATLLNKAMTALLKYHEESSSGEGKNELLGNDKLVQVQIGLAKVPHKATPKPIRVEISHPLHKVVKVKSVGGKSPDDYDDASDDDDDNLEEAEVCIFVKEESKPWVKDMVDKFPIELSCVKKVLGLQSLRTKHKRYQQRRELLDRFDIFLCDDRILPMVGKAIGKNFFEAKKQPVPIKLTRKEALPFAVQRCLRATYMYISAGTCINIRAGNTGMPIKYLIDNVQAIVSNAIDKVPGKWTNVCSISIKLPDSTSLPVYNKTPEELEEIARLAGSAKKKTGKEENGEEEEEAEEKRKQATSSAEEKKRKKELAAKSPLVRALKKQKLAAKEEADEAKPAADKSAKKKKKKAEVTPEKDASTKDEGKAEATTDKKKRWKQSEDKDVELSKKKKKDKAASTGKEEFIPSTKFVGSKRGYAFYKGKKGLGYYVDNPPQVDKMAMATFARLGNTPTKGGRRGTPKSGKKRRRGRR